jgi:mevalonate kinase
MTEVASYYAHGKLLLTGEYAVLDGALALAVPTQKGQWLRLYSTTNPQFVWRSLDEKGEIWFESIWTPELELVRTSDPEIAKRLKNLLVACVDLQPDFLFQLNGKMAETRLEFNRSWGLGSSSTLIYLLSEWADVSPYILLKKSFGGSGYDIACATAKGPILYQLQNTQPHVQTVDFHPEWTKNLYFIYLGKKQLSVSEIAKYADLKLDRKTLAEKISGITQQILKVPDLAGFQNLVLQHETIMADTLGYPKVGETVFSGIDGVFKSLGAWGGDFVLFAGKESSVGAIRLKGFDTVIPYDQMVIR